MKRRIPIVLVTAMIFGLAISQLPASGQGAAKPKFATATFAGGCFWCMQQPYDRTKGVISTVVGYTGGTVKNPTYEQVSTGTTGHREAIQVTYDPVQVSYEELVELFWRFVDPTQADGQFADRGSQYLTAVYYHSEEQRKIAERSKEKLGKSGVFSKPIVTEILPAAPFYPAEEYHQKYYLKKAEAYKRYAVGSGRVPFLERTWGGEKKPQ